MLTNPLGFLLQICDVLFNELLCVRDGDLCLIVNTKRLRFVMLTRGIGFLLHCRNLCVTVCDQPLQSLALKEHSDKQTKQDNGYKGDGYCHNRCVAGTMLPIGCGLSFSISALISLRIC